MPNTRRGPSGSPDPGDLAPRTLGATRAASTPRRRARSRFPPPLQPHRTALWPQGAPRPTSRTLLRSTPSMSTRSGRGAAGRSAQLAARHTSATDLPFPPYQMHDAGPRGARIQAIWRPTPRAPARARTPMQDSPFTPRVPLSGAPDPRHGLRERAAAALHGSSSATRALCDERPTTRVHALQARAGTADSARRAFQRTARRGPTLHFVTPTPCYCGLRSQEPGAGRRAMVRSPRLAPPIQCCQQCPMHSALLDACVWGVWA